MGQPIFSRVILALVLVCLLLAGCREENQDETVENSPTAAYQDEDVLPTPTSHIEATEAGAPSRTTGTPLTAEATKTPTPFPATNTPLPTITPRPVRQLVESTAATFVEPCIQETEVDLEELLLGENLRLVITQKSVSVIPPIWRLDFSEDVIWTELLSSDVEYVQPSLSPNGEWLAYTIWSNPEVGLENFTLMAVDSGEASVVIEGLSPDYRTYSWVNDELLVLLHSILTSDGERIGRPTQFVDVQTHQVREIPTFPPFVHQSAVWIGPDGEQALFISSDNHEWTLYHIPTGAEQNLIPSLSLVGISWAPHHPIIAIVSSDLHIFYFNEVIDHKTLGLPLPTDGSYAIQIMAWDNEGQKLAFEISQQFVTDVDTSWPPGLYIYDDNSNEITHYCTQMEVWYELKWSPDGRFLAWDTDEFFTRVVVMKVESGQFAVLEDAELLGWGVVN